MHEQISANWQNLLEQATGTAEKYFHDAVRTIDKFFGEGYAQKHPTLIGTFMEVFSEAFCQLSRSLDQIADKIDD